MERDPLLPTNVIKLSSTGVENSNWTIGKFDWAGQRSTFSYQRYMYTVCDNVLAVQDIFFGSSRKFELKYKGYMIKLLRYIHLETNRGFLVYHLSDTVYVSIVSIDLDGYTYELIGDHYCIFFNTGDSNADFILEDVAQISEDLVSVKGHEALVGGKIHIFKINHDFSTVRCYKTFDCSYHGQWFNLIDNRLVFARYCPTTHLDRYYLDSFMTLDLDGDGTFEVLEDSSTCLQSSVPLNESIAYPCGVQGCWFEEKLYVMCNFCPYDVKNSANIFFSVFEYRDRQWSQILLDLLPIPFSYIKFSIDYNGILNILYHQEIYGDDNELEHTKVMFFRFPFKQPESLLQLAWSKVRAGSLMQEKNYPKNFKFQQMF